MNHVHTTTRLLRGRGLAAALVAAALLLGLLAPAVAAAAAASPTEHRIGTFNMAGGNAEHGSNSPCGNEIKQGYDSGPYSLLCRAGESTHDDWIFEEGRPGGSKIDFLFASPHVEVRWADATYAIHSDHDPLWADVAF